MPSPFFSLKSNLHLWGLPRGETGICEATLGLRISGKKNRFDLTDEDAKRDNVRHNTKMACHVYLCQTPTIFWRIHKQQDSQLSLCDGCFHPAWRNGSTCHLCWENDSRDEAWTGRGQFRLSHYHYHHKPQNNDNTQCYYAPGTILGTVTHLTLPVSSFSALISIVETGHRRREVKAQALNPNALL